MHLRRTSHDVGRGQREWQVQRAWERTVLGALGWNPLHSSDGEEMEQAVPEAQGRWSMRKLGLGKQAVTRRSFIVGLRTSRREVRVGGQQGAVALT